MKMVGPGGVPRSNNYSGLVCPTSSKARYKCKGQFPRLSSRADVAARLAEVARRYAWQARQKRKVGQSKIAARARLITLIRLRELERLYVSRWGRFLPDDDAGRDDFVIAAHHIVHLGDDANDHIVAWARMWCPWMAVEEAAAIAAEAIARPVKWTADTLGWRLGLTDAERTALKITTIGGIDVSKTQRLERRKERRRAADRARRAKRSSGKPRGRPKKKCEASRY
jgi:hypothetical protein